MATNPSQYDHAQLLRCARGELFGADNAQLPNPPMLMFDRIINITADGGAYGKGQIVAELDIKPDLWFFECHFAGDPVMPGCLGLDAMWQLLGFYLGWRGNPGRGRALGAGDVKFGGEVRPTNHRVSYRLDIRRVINRKLVMGIADGVMAVDGDDIYSANGLRVGLFTQSASVLEEIA